jgi:hypothetical protein
MVFLRLFQGPLCKFAGSLCNFPIYLGLLVMSSDVYECSFSGACTVLVQKKEPFVLTLQVGLSLDLEL